MIASQWFDVIVGAVNNPAPDQLNALAQHLSQCEEAKTLLRAKGYGMAGQPIHETMRQVPHARDFG